MNQNTAPTKLFFASDYMEGAHPLILQRLMETNLLHTAGYGTDEFSESARVKIRKACDAPDADIYFLVGGTQTNATVIGSILRPYQGVIAAETGDQRHRDWIHSSPLPGRDRRGDRPCKHSRGRRDRSRRP